MDVLFTDLQATHDYVPGRNYHHRVDFHSCYTKFPRYPFGLLDVLGYWAETQLFGGVLLFDRGESGSEVCQHLQTLTS